jgi:hypothetical protein
MEPTMTYEFQSTLFGNASEMHAAIAGEFLSAGGMNSEDFQREYLADHTNEEMADEAIEGWDLSGEWAEKRDFTRDDLIEAFADLRKAMK